MGTIQLKRRKLDISPAASACPRAAFNHRLALGLTVRCPSPYGSVTGAYRVCRIYNSTCLAILWGVLPSDVGVRRPCYGEQR